MVDASSTRLARDVREHIPPRSAVQGYYGVREQDAGIWQRAASFLTVRNNDAHTLYAYGVAQALCDVIPEADREVVLPAILLHDTGWSTVQPELILEAIAPGGGRKELVLQHEKEGARIATEILTELGYDPAIIAEVVDIIDGHDTRLSPISLNDSLVKDADKLWRVTPNGIEIVCGWFNLTPDEALRITCARVHDALFTDQGKAMARALTSVTAISLSPEVAAIPS